MIDRAAIEPRRSALRTWLVVRVAIATVVLGLAYSLFTPTDSFEQTETTIVIEAIVAFAILTSFLIATYVEGRGSTLGAGILLLGLDILLVTASVGVTGGAGSVLAVLYGAVVLGAATTLGGSSSYAAGTLALVCYAVVGIGMARGVLPRPDDQPTRLYALTQSELIFAVLSNATAIGVVAMLSNWLAAQLARTGGELERSQTDLERLARQNEAIVRSIRAGLLTVSAEGRITSANPAALELLDCPESTLLSTPLLRWFPDMELVPGAVATRDETLAARSDGSRFPAGYSLSAMRGDESHRSDVLLTFQDLTEIRALEAAAHDAERLATLGRVAATLAHEIRNPLSSISGSVELVRESGALAEEDRHLLTIVVHEVERIDQLVRDMLDVARPRPPRYREEDVIRLCREIAELASHSLETDVRVGVRATGSGMATFDPDQMRQVVWNLVKNAVQASPAGGHVTIAVDSDEDGAFEILVDDEGSGIPEADLARIFDAFHTRRARGTGLGLALVRQVVDGHGGTIDAMNRPGGGARFRLRVPPIRPSGSSEGGAESDSTRPVAQP